MDAEVDLHEKLPGGDREGWGDIAVRLASSVSGRVESRLYRVDPPVVEVVGGGVGPCGEGLAQAWRAVAGADVAVAADCVGELDESSVLRREIPVPK
jgi:hypothetical protein